MKLLNERGNSIVMLVISMVVIIAFAAFTIDIGFATYTKNNLQNTADAAALAGAHKRAEKGATDTDAINEAKTYVEKNFPDATKKCEVYNEGTYGKRVKVTVEKEMDSYFAKIINIPTIRVKAHAVAECSPAREMNGLKPFGIFTNTYPDKLTEKDWKDLQPPNPGNFGTVALEYNGKDSGTDVLLNNVVNGTTKYYEKGDNIGSEPGDASKVKKAILELFKKNGNPNTLIIYVPVIDYVYDEKGDPVKDGGRLKLEIKGFAAFELPKPDTSEKDKDYIVQGKIVSFDVIPAVGDSNYYNVYGQKSVNLIE